MTLDQLQYERDTYKRLLDQACAELAKWKVRAEFAEAQAERLRRALHEKPGAVIRMPIGKVR
jgi:hypothetical protein